MDVFDEELDYEWQQNETLVNDLLYVTTEEDNIETDQQSGHQNDLKSNQNLNDVINDESNGDSNENIVNNVEESGDQMVVPIDDNCYGEESGYTSADVMVVEKNLKNKEKQKPIEDKTGNTSQTLKNSNKNRTKSLNSRGNCLQKCPTKESIPSDCSSNDKKSKEMEKNKKFDEFLAKFSSNSNPIDSSVTQTYNRSLNISQNQKTNKNKTKHRISKETKKTKRQTVDRSLDQLRDKLFKAKSELNSIAKLSKLSHSSVNTSNKSIEEIQTIDLVDNSGDSSEVMDEEVVCETCVVVLNRYSDRIIAKALKGKLEFEECIDSEESDDNIVHHFNQFPPKSPEINLSDNSDDFGFCDSENQTQTKKKNCFTAEENLNAIIDNSKTVSKEVTEKKGNHNKTKKKGRNGLNLLTLEEHNEIKRKLDQMSEKKKKSLNNGINEKTALKDIKNTEISQKQIKSKTKRNPINGESNGKRKKSKNLKTTITAAVEDNIEYDLNTKNLTNKELEEMVGKYNVSQGSVTHIMAEQYKCDKCLFVAEEEMELLLHSLIHTTDDTTDQPFCRDCHICSEIFLTKHLFERHIEEVHPNTDNQIDCKTNHLFFTTNQSLLGLTSDENQMDLASDQIQMGFTNPFVENHTKPDLLSTAMTMTFGSDPHSYHELSENEDQDYDDLFF